MINILSTNRKKLTHRNPFSGASELIGSWGTAQYLFLTYTLTLSLSEWSGVRLSPPSFLTFNRPCLRQNIEALALEIPRTAIKFLCILQFLSAFLTNTYFEPANKKSASSFSGAPDFLGMWSLLQFFGRSIHNPFYNYGRGRSHPLKFLSLRSACL